MNWILEKCGSLAVLVSLRTIFPLSASATNRSTENTLRVDRNAIHRPSGLGAGPQENTPRVDGSASRRPSGLIAGPTFRSAARPFPSPTRRPTWLGGVVA